jgi:hypothetical protein
MAQPVTAGKTQAGRGFTHYVRENDSLSWRFDQKMLPAYL